MKQAVFLFLFFSFLLSFSVSANDDQYYIIYDQDGSKREKNDMQEKKYQYNYSDYVNRYDNDYLHPINDKNVSKKIIKNEIGSLKNEIRTSKNIMYNEIRQFKYNF